MLILFPASIFNLERKKKLDPKIAFVAYISEGVIALFDLEYFIKKKKKTRERKRERERDGDTDHINWVFF